MKQAISPQTAFQDLTFTSVEEFIAKVLHLDRAGLQENFKIQGHENEGYFEYCLLERAIGWGSLHRVAGAEMILWDRFGPLASLPEEQAEKLKRRGIGTLAQIETCLYIIPLMGSHAERLMIAHHGLSTERRRQLERIGIKQDVYLHGLTTDFAEVFPTYLQKWIDYANSKGFHFENPLGVEIGRRK